jgi:hypothetical protein
LLTSRIVLLAGGDRLAQSRLDALGFHRLGHFVGQALAVGALVVDHRNLLALELLGEVGTGHLALLVITTGDGEDVLQAAIGDLRVGRHGDHRDVGLDIDFGRRDGRRRAPVAVHEDDLLVHHLVGDGDGLFRIAGVVADFELQLLAINATLGVDVGRWPFRRPCGSGHPRKRIGRSSGRRWATRCSAQALVPARASRQKPADRMCLLMCFLLCYGAR